MNSNYTIKWEGSNPVITFNEYLELNFVIEALNNILADVRFEKLDYLIVDYLNVKDITINELDVDVISSLTRTTLNWNKEVRNANIVTHPLLIEQIGMFNEIMKETKWTAEVFADHESALNWCERGV